MVVEAAEMVRISKHQTSHQIRIVKRVHRMWSVTMQRTCHKMQLPQIRQRRRYQRPPLPPPHHQQPVPIRQMPMPQTKKTIQKQQPMLARPPTRSVQVAKVKRKIAGAAVCRAIKPIPHHMVHCVEVVFIIGGTYSHKPVVNSIFDFFPFFRTPTRAF